MANSLKYWHNGLPFIGSPRNYFDLGTFNFMYDGVLPFEVPDTYAALHPDADTSGGSWINQGGLTSPLYPSIDEVTPLDSDFIQSQNLNTCKISLSNPYGIVSAPFTINYRLGYSTPYSSAAIRVRLLQGTTQIAVWWHSGLSTAQTTFSQTLTAAQYAAITDFNDLYLEFYSYLGPGDIVGPSTLGWWGLRAYRADKIGVPVIRLRRVADNAEQDFTTLSDGSLDVASISAWIYGGGGSPDVSGLSPDATRVVKLYDQTGNGHDATEPTQSRQLIFVLNGLGSLPVLRSNSADNLGLHTPASSFPVAPPCTYSVVANRTFVSGSFNHVLTTSGNEIRIGFHTSANTAWMYSGTSLTASATDNSWHALQGLFNGANSTLVVDGAATTGDAGTPAADTGPIIADVASYNGDLVECGMWSGNFTAAQYAAMNTNQHNYWGF